MKQYLIALSLAYGLTACEYEDGKDGVNGINGADGQSCEIVNDGELQCGEDVIAIRGEKGEQGQKGDDGVSCKIETNQDGDFVVCGDQSVRIPPETSERDLGFIQMHMQGLDLPLALGTPSSQLFFVAESML